MRNTIAAATAALAMLTTTAAAQANFNHRKPCPRGTHAVYHTHRGGPYRVCVRNRHLAVRISAASWR